MLLVLVSIRVDSIPFGTLAFNVKTYNNIICRDYDNHVNSVDIRSELQSVNILMFVLNVFHVYFCFLHRMRFRSSIFLHINRYFG